MRCWSRGDTWILVGAALFSACAGPATESPRGPSAFHAAPRRQRLALIDEAKDWPRAAAPFVSRGHGDGRVTVDIRISPGNLEAVRNLVLGQFVPVGTVAVAFHAGARTGVEPSVFVMQKQGEGKWEFLVADSEGTLASGGTSPACARCHADAPTDFLFVSAEMAAAPPSTPSRDAGR